MQVKAFKEGMGCNELVTAVRVANSARKVLLLASIAEDRALHDPGVRHCVGVG